jgi:hypothetical protein
MDRLFAWWHEIAILRISSSPIMPYTRKFSDFV